MADVEQVIRDSLMLRGNFTFNKPAKLVAYRSDIIRLTVNQYNILEYLAEQPLRIRGAYDIAHAAGIPDDIDQYWSVASHIKRLRRKFPEEANPIGSVWGAGWYFDDGTDAWIK